MSTPETGTTPDDAQNAAPPDVELNPMQAAYMQKLFATYEANLRFFQIKFPYVFKRLIDFDAEVPFSLGEEGELTIYYRNNIGNAKDFVELGKTLYTFFNDPESRPRITTGANFLDNEAIVAPQADMPYFFEPVEPRFRLQLVRRLKEIYPEYATATSHASQFGDKSLLITVVFGVGFGWDIEQIVDNYEMRHLIIIEPNARNLNLSLFFVDYVSLYHRFMARGGQHFTFLTYDPKKPATEEEAAQEKPLATGDDPYANDEDSAERNKALATDLRMAIRMFWPPYMARGVALHFNDYRSEDVRAIWSALGKEMFLLYMGWGFFDDEILSLLHATQNLDGRYPLCTKFAKNMAEDSVAFVVGSGPSLDEQLPLIEANKDKAIIISCGTALTVLARKGIKPDFHIEIERTDLTYDFMADPKHRDFVKDIPLLLIPAIPPGVFELTNKPLMLLKFVDAGSQLADIDNLYPRYSTGPTVTNCGTDFCLRMGIKNIFLLGVDVGYPIEGPHHSTLSHYYDEEHETENLADVVKQTEIACNRRIPVPGNFGDEVHSTEIFIQARDLIAHSIAQFPASKVFNLNKGAAIKGAEPLHLEDAVIPGNATVKQESLQKLFDCFTTDYYNNPDQNIANLCEQMDAVMQDAHQILVRDFKNTLEVCDALRDFEHYLNAGKHQRTAVFPMLRGSTLHICRVLFECMTMIPDQERALKYAHEGIQTIFEFLNAGKELIEKIPAEARKRAAERREKQGAGAPASGNPAPGTPIA